MKNILLAPAILLYLPLFYSHNLLASEQSSTERYVLVVSLWHSMIKGEALYQEIDVSLESSFKIVTKVGKTQWTISGKVGKKTKSENVVPVKFGIEWQNGKSNEKSIAPLKLKIGAKPGVGDLAIHGIYRNVSIRGKKVKKDP